MTKKMQFSFISLYPNSSTCFGRCFCLSSGAHDCIYGFWYSSSMLLPAGVMDEMELQFHLVHDIDRQQHRWTISEAVNTVECSWWWAKISTETCRADCLQINKQKICILLVIDYEIILTMDGHTNIKILILVQVLREQKKKVLFENKEIILWNKRNFVENKTEIIEHILKIQ